MGSNIGVDRFSDVPGDFTTLSFHVYDRNGVSTLNVQDSSSGWEKTGSSPSSYLPLCTNTPVLLNKLHFDEACRDGQIFLWKKIMESPIIDRQQYYKPLDVIFVHSVASHPFKYLIAIFLIFWASMAIPANKLFRYLLVFSRKHSRNIISVTPSVPLIPRLAWAKAFITQLRQHFRVFVSTALLVTAGLIASQTKLFEANHISCTSHKLSTDTRHNISSTFLNYSTISICLDEIITPVDSWLGIVNVVFTLYDKSGKSVRADAIFFIKENVSFADAAGDIMYQNLKYYNNKGLLIRHDSDITSEHYENLMPPVASHALWQEVKDKASRVADTRFISPSRLMYLVIVNSLPLMIAGCLLIYSYGISLPFLLSLRPSSETKPDDG